MIPDTQNPRQQDENVNLAGCYRQLMITGEFPETFCQLSAAQCFPVARDCRMSFPLQLLRSRRICV